MPEGVIVGGWPSVIAAYSITAIVLGLYVWSLFHRGRRAVRPAGTRAASETSPRLKRPDSVPAVRSEENADDD